MLTRRTDRDEAGSMIIAIGVLFVLSLLTAGVFSRSLSSQNQVRNNQNFNAGLAAADAGLSDALFQLDQGLQASTFTNSRGLGNGTFSYTANKLTDNEYEIRSSGIVNGRRHDVMATAKQRRRWDFIFYGRELVNFNGNCGTFQGPVGAAGRITGTGTTTGNCIPIAECYLRDDGSRPPASEGCGETGQPNPNGKRLDETNRKPAIELPTDLTNLGCPAADRGVITGPVDGRNGTGFYQCTRPAGTSLSGTISVVNPPVYLYVTNGVLETGRLTNLNGPDNPAADFQVFVAAASDLQFATGTRVRAGIYAPQSVATFQPSVNFKGGVVAREIRVNGAPTLGVHDTSLNRIIVESWKISRYREVSTSCTTNC